MPHLEPEPGRIINHAFPLSAFNFPLSLLKAIVATIHGILSGGTDPGWPEKFEGWAFRRDPELHIIKRHYLAGPFPRWNCWIKNPALAVSLAAEINLCLDHGPLMVAYQSPPLWLLAHSNGAQIALLTADSLIASGRRIGGVIFTGAAVEADLAKNNILDWYQRNQLGAAISYSSEDDAIVAGDYRAPTQWYWRARDWLWGKAMAPYGSLGRTGWLKDGQPFGDSVMPEIKSVFTRWYPGGHCAYFAPDRINCTFEQIYQDILHPSRLNGRRAPTVLAASR